MDAMLSRLKAELKTYHNMNNTQVMKNSENLKKTNSCLERTLAVLTNKLQSHKKKIFVNITKKTIEVIRIGKQYIGQIRKQSKKYNKFEGKDLSLSKEWKIGTK